MMLNLAQQLNPYFDSGNKDVSLKLIFFDGEEAFRQWTVTDSLYGSRHLAEKYENSLYTTKDNENINELGRIDILVLLDLLGKFENSISSIMKTMFLKVYIGNNSAA